MAVNKKEQELQCLQKVIEAGKRSRGYTKRIIGMLGGEDMCRIEQERPDFVRVVPNMPNNAANIIIGIEHFRVDHFSLQKTDGKVASKAALYEKNISNVYEKWHQHVVDTNDIPTEAVSDIADLVANGFTLKKEATYSNFIKSFKYSLDKHMNSIGAYRKNISKLTNGKIEIALLIEIHSDFIDLFLNDNKGTHKNSSGIMPMFADIVRLLETIDV